MKVNYYKAKVSGLFRVDFFQEVVRGDFIGKGVVLVGFCSTWGLSEGVLSCTQVSYVCVCKAAESMLY